MTCRKVRKLLPLVAGGDLDARRTAKIMAHVATCPECGKELANLREALARVKVMAREEAAPEWTSGEWHSLMSRIVAQEVQRRGRRVPSAPRVRRRWAFAFGLTAVAVLAVLVVVFRNSLFRLGPGGGPSQAAIQEPKAGQNVISVTLVSQQTGLQVVWFFNKNFEWKGDLE